MAKHWIAFFSQSGKEIADLSEKLGRWPTRIVTNERPEHLRTVDKRIEKQGYFTLPNKPTVDDYNVVLEDNALVTLHGWLRIIPPEICERYKIYNGHPGLVNLYSGLKGYNSQERIVGKQAEYRFIGSVVHKVTAQVDEGEVLVYSKVSNNVRTVEQAYKVLRETSFKAWIEFFNTVL